MPSEHRITLSELSELQELNDYLDDPPIGVSVMRKIVPPVERLLAAAWYATEDAIRQDTGQCSSIHTLKEIHAPQTGPTFTCQCCRYFHQIAPGAQELIRRAGGV